MVQTALQQPAVPRAFALCSPERRVSPPALPAVSRLPGLTPPLALPLLAPSFLASGPFWS